MLEKIAIHIFVNLRLYMHLFAILMNFLMSYLMHLLVGIPFLGYGEVVGLIFIYFFMEYYYKKNEAEYKKTLKEIRMKDWE